MFIVLNVILDVFYLFGTQKYLITAVWKKDLVCEMFTLAREV